MRFHHKKSQLNSEKWIDGLFISSIDSKTNLATWTGYGQTWMMIWNTFVHIYISKWFMWIIQSYDDLPLLSHFPIARSVFVFIQMATRQMIKATVAHAHTSHTCVWTQACESNKYIRVLTPNNYQQELWRKKNMTNYWNGFCHFFRKSYADWSYNHAFMQSNYIQFVWLLMHRHMHTHSHTYCINQDWR